jgi:ribosomal protein S18 acetylase RimI-like enzyme
MKMKIRRANPNDVESLVAFNQAMALETENKVLDSKTLTSGVKGILENQARGFYLVAEDQGEIAGSLMVTFEWSDWRNANFWWVQSVYILPQHRRQGVYSQLYNEIRRLADDSDNVCGYRLYVEKDNLAAQKTYESLGMSESHYLMFES